MASVFSGKAGRNTAIWTAQEAALQRADLDTVALKGYQGQKAPISQGFKQGLSALKSGYEGARDFTTGGYRSGIDQLQQTQAQQLGALGAGYGTAMDELRSGYGQGISALQQGYGAARDTWAPIHQQNMAGYGMYQNALGLGGAEGTAAAQNAFQTGPGYQWNVDQGVEQTARMANKYGALYGGNTNDATTRLASNLANQEYNNWVKNLQGFQGAAMSSTGAISDIYGQEARGVADIYGQQGRGLAELNTGLANAQSGVYGTTGTNIANAYIGQGKDLATLRNEYGQNTAGLQVAKGQSLGGLAGQYWGNIANNINQQFQTVIPAGQQGMMAGQQAAANRMGALMGGLQLGSQILGGGKGFLSGMGFGGS